MQKAHSAESHKASDHMDAIVSVTVVSSSGPMLKLVYKLQAEEYKYEVPVTFLPVSPQAVFSHVRLIYSS